MHPFTEKLQPDEALLWVGRPNQALSRKRARLRFKRRWTGLGVLSGALMIGLLDPPSKVTVHLAFCFLICMASWLAIELLCFTEVYKHAAWYAVTNQRVLVSLLDEGRSVFHNTEWKDVRSVQIDSITVHHGLKEEVEVGTLLLRRHHGITTLLNPRLKIEWIEHPYQVEALIKDALGQNVQIEMS